MVGQDFFPSRRDIFQANATLIAGVLIFLTLFNPFSSSIQETAQNLKERAEQYRAAHDNGTLVDPEYTNKLKELQSIKNRTTT